MNYTKNICDSAMPSFADACKAYVEAYSPIIFKLADKYLQPDKICQVGGNLCVCPCLGSQAQRQ